MKKTVKRWLSIMLVIAMFITTFTACSKKAEETGSDSAAAPTEAAQEPVATQAPTVAPTEEPAIDLGGMEIVIGDWWSPQEPAAPANAQEEATLEYRNMIQEKYNFKIKQVAVADWGTMQETFTTSTMAGTPAAQVFLLGQGWVSQPLANDLLYDLSTLENFDFTESKWNQTVLNKMNFGDSIYGMASGKAEPKLGVFWNKRLFEEAGLDPDLPYDLQASGEWTWDKYEELCKKLTIDSNNDGTIDSYAQASFSSEYLAGAITSNDARYIGKDATTGKYYNATTEPNFLEAAQWAVGLIKKGYEMPVPKDSNWDWFIAAFHDAKVAMAWGEQYKVGQWADMTDDWGFVLCPKGPKSTNYSVYFSDNIAVIPSCYDAETAEKIAFAYNLYTNPTPGYEDENAWKDSYYTKFRDERAVDETLTRMYDPATIVNNDYSAFVYGVDQGNFLWDTYALTKTPQEKIDEVTGLWASLIEDANK